MKAFGVGQGSGSRQWEKWLLQNCQWPLAPGTLKTGPRLQGLPRSDHGHWRSSRKTGKLGAVMVALLMQVDLAQMAFSGGIKCCRALWGSPAWSMTWVCLTSQTTLETQTKHSHFWTLELGTLPTHVCMLPPHHSQAVYDLVSLTHNSKHRIRIPVYLSQ